jgi:hypothetical protein
VPLADLQSVLADHHGVDVRHRTAVLALEIVPLADLQSVFANHHGVDARHRACAQAVCESMILN